MQSNKKWTVSCVVLVMLISVGMASVQALPRSLQGKPITVVKNKPIKGYSCGFQTLFNALTLEKHVYGGTLTKLAADSQGARDTTAFKKVVDPYLAKKKLHGRIGMKSDLLCELASLLDIEQYHFFAFEGKDGIRPLLHKECPNKVAERRSIMRSIKEALGKGTKEKPACVHCGCYCIVAGGEEHSILVSLVQAGKKITLYVYDNLNDPITAQSDITIYLREFCKFLGI